MIFVCLFVKTRSKQLNLETIDTAFRSLLELQIQLLGISWPENVRLHALAALAVFINLFQARFFQSGPLDCLLLLIESLLLQLNSRSVKIQNAAAALLQLVLRNGFDFASAVYCKKQNKNPFLICFKIQTVNMSTRSSPTITTASITLRVWADPARKPASRWRICSATSRCC